MCTSNIIWDQATDNLLMYYANKWNIDQNQLYKIEWYAYSRAIKKLSTNEALQITKLSTNWLPTNKHLQKIDKTTATCPICNIHSESINHMISCTIQNHPHLLENFFHNLKKLKTNPRIIHCISRLIRNTDDYSSLLEKYADDKDITHALKQQRSIETSLLHHGKIEKGWKYAQETYNLY